MTSIVNIGFFYFFAELGRIDYLISNAFAWLLSVTFAFFTNKYFVFFGRNKMEKKTSIQYLYFFGARLFTGIADMGLMFTLVSLAAIDEIISKVLVSALVIILNYIVSKNVVFR
jgi:putative flippase GtrA